MAANHHIRSQEVVTGRIGPHDSAVETQPFTTGPDTKQKPWYDLRSFQTFVQERAQRISLRFSRGKPYWRRRRGQTVGSKTNTLDPPLSTRTSSTPNTRSQRRDSRIFDEFNQEDVVGTKAETVGKSVLVEAQTTSQNTEVARSGPSVAFMVERVPRHEAPDLSQVSKATSLKASTEGISSTRTSLDTNFESGQSNISSELFDLRPYSETARQAGGYVPPIAGQNDDEFTSSAVMVKDKSDKLKAVKLFYDTMSTDNWASEAFVKACGFQPRPIRPDDLKVYKTIKGEFIPTHYVEMELKDEFRGMKDFTKLSLNVTPSMDGIGLIAGRAFMKEHHIVVDANARRDVFVTTSRKAGPKDQERQRQLLKRAKEEYERGKELSSSTAGPSTRRSDILSAEKPLGLSSRTSTSSDIKSNVSKR
ncbi:hypothetical protein EG329_007791 [Mollisiaceae sp. DMI_Dod_QoI]|nr:hypothetical protein EG329_007791 [Helotiales sp. DMI_Dod_QoI]